MNTMGEVKERKKMRQFWGVMESIYILILVIGTCIYIHVESHKTEGHTST